MKAFQSNIQENKDWNLWHPEVWRYSPPFQSNIQENKDWNSIFQMLHIDRPDLSEQHPREQGLKQDYEVVVGGWVASFQSNIQENKDWNISSNQRFCGNPRRLSEQHPREQGLKPTKVRLVWFMILAFQSNIQENKDWNRIIS